MELHGFVPVDKPQGWTSHDVVGRLRRILGLKRIGHAGTLDPAATGVVIAGVGRATRFLDYVQQESKEYVAHIVLGVTSDTGDIDGSLVATSSERPSIDQILDARSRFTGVIDQVPPRFSAIKVDGEPLYRKARRGEPVSVPVRRVNVLAIECLGYNYPDLFLRIACGAGTYIRSIAADLGAELGTGAYLHHLVRTRSGAVGLGQCRPIDELRQYRFPDDWPHASIAIDQLLSAELPAVFLEESGSTSWYHGRSVEVTATDKPCTKTQARCYVQNAMFAGIARLEYGTANGLLIRPRIVVPAS